jgi:hypothetical protein
LNETGGIWPMTKCAKSLLNGLCGGSQEGKFEIDPGRDCAWVLIYKRVAALEELERSTVTWVRKITVRLPSRDPCAARK